MIYNSGGMVCRNKIQIVVRLAKFIRILAADAEVVLGSNVPMSTSVGSTPGIRHP